MYKYILFFVMNNIGPVHKCVIFRLLTGMTLRMSSSMSLADLGGADPAPAPSIGRQVKKITLKNTKISCPAPLLAG
jgi:hypothetical protein